MIVVVDANVLISAYTADGLVCQLWKRGFPGVEVFVSPEVVIETEKALRRLDFHLTGGEIRAILLDLLSRVRVERLRDTGSALSFALEDRHVVELALQLKADYIITADKHYHPSVRGPHYPQVIALQSFCDDVLRLPALTTG